MTTKSTNPSSLGRANIDPRTTGHRALRMEPQKPGNAGSSLERSGSRGSQEYRRPHQGAIPPGLGASKNSHPVEIMGVGLCKVECALAGGFAVVWGMCKFHSAGRPCVIVGGPVSILKPAVDATQDVPLSAAPLRTCRFRCPASRQSCLPKQKHAEASVPT